MTEQEKQQLVDAVITQLKQGGTDVSTATVVEDVGGVSYVLCYDTNGNIVRVTPSTFDGVSEITWGQSNHIDNYIESGVYNIKGTRWVNDGLPITNVGENATIAARLVVTVTPEGATTYRHSIGQTLILSNAEGKETKVYTRNGNRTSTDGGVTYTVSWGPWATLQTNINVGAVDNLDNLKDNGIYSGVWTTGAYNAYPLTFVCIVINDYIVGTAPRRISQFVYGLSKFDGSTVYQNRVWDDSKNAWSDWEILNQTEISSMISMEISKEVTRATEAEAGLSEYISQVEESANKTNTDLAETKKNIASSLHASSDADSVTITGKSDVGKTTFSADIPAATTESAGAMSAEDKIALNTATSRALRRLFIAAGAEYNDTGADKTKTTSWGESVVHKAGHYYLNGLGDITEEQMVEIYNTGHLVYSPNIASRYARKAIRTNLIHKNTGWNVSSGAIDAVYMFYYCSNLETCVLSNLYWNEALGYNYFCFQAGNIRYMFDNCKKLKTIEGVISCETGKTAGFMQAFSRCPLLTQVNVYKLNQSISFINSPNFSKSSIIYAVSNASPTSAITITLHPDAYARLADDVDIVAALEAKNTELATSGSGSISLVSA